MRSYCLNHSSHPERPPAGVVARAAFAVCAAWLVVPVLVQAQLGPERAASLVLYPYVVTDPDAGRDTILQLSNASGVAVDVRCIFENANGHCGGRGAICSGDEDCPAGQGCEPGFATTTFDVRLTPGQPLGWRASQGLAVLPAAGNQGAIPAVPELPFLGSLRCFATDDGGVAIAAEALHGLATIERYVAGPEEQIDVAKYAALGAHVEGRQLTDDGRLILGRADAEDAEYDGCPNFLEFQNVFTPAFAPGDRAIETTLVLLPCSVFYADERPGQAEVSYLIINEFDERRQRDTPIHVKGLFAARLDEIDPLLYSRAAQGTDGGKTRMTSLGSGVVGLVIDTYRDDGDPNVTHSAARELFQQGDRVESDVISFVEATCGGDCNGDGRVDVAEVVNAVSISLGAPVGLCSAADSDGSGVVEVDELIAAVNNLLGGCR